MISSMRILLLNHNLYQRGTYFRARAFAEWLAGAGHAVTLLTCADAPRLYSTQFTTTCTEIRTPRWGRVGRHDGGYGPVDNLWRAGHALTHRYDAVVAFDHRPNVALPAWLARLRGRPIVFADWADWWTRGGILAGRRAWAWMDGLEARIEEGTKRHAAAVTVISRALYARARSLGIPEERLLLLPPASPIEAIRPQPAAACRARLGLPQDAPLILMAGHAVWDAEILLRAFEIVHKSIKNSQLAIVGSDREGRVARCIAGISAGTTAAAPRNAGKDPSARLRGAAGGTQTYRDCVTVLPTVPFAELQHVLGAADVLALPMADTLANRGRFPNRLADYFAAGRAVVASNVGDVGAAVRESGAGWAVPPTAEGMAAGLCECLASPERRNDSARAARRAAEGPFAPDRRKLALLEFYQRWGVHHG